MSWVTNHTGIALSVTPLIPDLEPEIATSVQLALRRNPLRAQLLVSSVLGKHVPVRASLCLQAGQRLAEAVSQKVAGPYDVIGFAETATGLGHQVAHGLDAAMYVHTTRRPGDFPRLDFLEEHSHATQQALTPAPNAFTSGHTAVLVDDEISTGRTALNAIAAIAGVTGHRTWVLASLLDTRSAEDVETCNRRASELGITLLNAALLRGTVTLPETAPTIDFPCLPRDLAPITARTIELTTPTFTARRSFTQIDDTALRQFAKEAAQAVGPMEDVIVVGDEELMYLPQLIARELDDALVCTTTRSPVLPVDEDGYPIRTGIAFDSIREPGRVAYSYNTAGAKKILLVSEDPVDGRVLAAFDTEVTSLVIR